MDVNPLKLTDDTPVSPGKNKEYDKIITLIRDNYDTFKMGAKFKLGLDVSGIDKNELLQEIIELRDNNIPFDKEELTKMLTEAVKMRNSDEDAPYGRIPINPLTGLPDDPGKKRGIKPSRENSNRFYDELITNISGDYELFKKGVLSGAKINLSGISRRVLVTEIRELKNKGVLYDEYVIGDYLSTTTINKKIKNLHSKIQEQVSKDQEQQEMRTTEDLSIVAVILGIIGVGAIYFILKK